MSEFWNQVESLSVSLELDALTYGGHLGHSLQLRKAIADFEAYLDALPEGHARALEQMTTEDGRSLNDCLADLHTDGDLHQILSSVNEILAQQPSWTESQDAAVSFGEADETRLSEQQHELVRQHELMEALKNEPLLRRRDSTGMYDQNNLMGLLPTLPAADRLLVLLQKDHRGISAMGQVVQNPKRFQELLTLLPQEDRLRALAASGPDGQTVLHHVADNTQRMNELLDSLPPHHTLAALEITDCYGNTVLHACANAAGAFNQLAARYNNLAQAVPLNQTNNVGETILHLAVRSEEALKAVLQRLQGDELRESIGACNKFGWTVLHYAVSFGTPETLALLMEALPEEQRSKALRVKAKDGSSVLDGCRRKPEKLQVVLGYLTTKEQRAVVKKKGPLGMTPLSAACMNPEVFEQMLQSLPSSIRRTALLASNRHGDCALSMALSNESTARLLFSVLSEEEIDELPIDQLFQNASTVHRLIRAEITQGESGGRGMAPMLRDNFQRVLSRIQIRERWGKRYFEGVLLAHRLKSQKVEGFQKQNTHNRVYGVSEAKAPSSVQTAWKIPSNAQEAQHNSMPVSCPEKMPRPPRGR